MNDWSKRIAYGLVAVLSLMVATPGILGFQEKKKKEKPEFYQASMVGVTGGFGARSVGVTIRIRGQTSDEQVREYLEMIAESGDTGLHSPLRRALEKVKGMGTINADGFIGTDLAIVRERETEEGKLITLVTARNLPMIELYAGGRSRDYPFSYIQLLVNKKGKGQGTIILAARAKFNKEGKLHVESYGIQPFQLFNVRRR